MIEKLNTAYIQVESDGNAKLELANKINELVDAVNELQKHKEPAEAECVKLQNELDRTRKALEIAVDALKRLEKELYFNNAKQTGHIADSVMSIPSIALEQITALEQKDK